MIIHISTHNEWLSSWIGAWATLLDSLVCILTLGFVWLGLGGEVSMFFEEKEALK